MAVPKSKISNSKKNKRRSHDAIDLLNIIEDWLVDHDFMNDNEIEEQLSFMCQKIKKSKQKC